MKLPWTPVGSGSQLHLQFDLQKHDLHTAWQEHTQGTKLYTHIILKLMKSKDTIKMKSTMSPGYISAFSLFLLLPSSLRIPGNVPIPVATFSITRHFSFNQGFTVAGK